MVFIQILLPVFIIFALGYIGQKKIGFDVKNLSVMALYLMSPILAFRTFYQTPLDIRYIHMLVYSVLLCVLLLFIIFIIGKLLGYTRSEQCGVMLAAAFMNNGNYGTPVVLFAFGAAGLDYAVVLMVFQSLLMSTFGLFIAALGGRGQVTIKASLASVIRMPIIYGAFGGLLIQLVSLTIPEYIFIAVDFVADATVPTIMIILGMQLASISLKRIPVGKVTVALVIRLVVSPVIALLLVIMLPVDEMLAKIMILMAAMPTAANTTMYSLQFGTEPDLVSSSTLISTLLSLVTLPILLWVLL
ncbi:AEC family transporter [Alkalihalophilus lindianensis]|uniref:AEC family transporter n=1 Tax=Alkalihalophilus lindianensis TaxID=1630542 RepID=A0ABU3X940_9BACI|nr:AEC family transporter [Alkalihalophilus lindianensis]MDV2684384.1 AEC family transporter [Alkalihalophilus lindianensis]